MRTKPAGRTRRKPYRTQKLKLISGVKIRVDMNVPDSANPYTATLFSGSRRSGHLGSFVGKTYVEARRRALRHANAIGLCQKRRRNEKSRGRYTRR